ncbi:MAG: T9SS type A sorting domain-containing protein [Bacteroidales bacterium]|nr:T9SS type A sorting domain-containing protein [Bacteroidales bacterium]
MKLLLSTRFILFFFLLNFIAVSDLYTQFAPSARLTTSDAIHADSNIFIGWATSCEVSRGFVQINRPDLGIATFGNDNDAIGKADNTVVSLGDGGSAVLQFEYPLRNNPGPDFAVFENSFSNTFLELAHVEASSDGVNFVRFPSVSLTQFVSQITTFGTLEAENIHNLAGKYQAFFGVPFDLSDLENTESININNVTHVRIIDVVGSIDTNFCSRDSAGRIINDPWPTPFPSSGFDLDAVGVIHDIRNLGLPDLAKNEVLVYPNPFVDFISISSKKNTSFDKVEVFDLTGKMIFGNFDLQDSEQIDLSFLNAGVYFLKVSESKRVIMVKIIKQ